MSIRVQLWSLRAALTASEGDIYDYYASGKGRPNRVLVIGGAAHNPVMTSVLANVLGAPVFRPAYPSEVTSSALGAATKAAWCYARQKASSPSSLSSSAQSPSPSSSSANIKGKGPPPLSLRDFLSALEHGCSLGGGLGLVKMAEPDEDEFENYGSVMTEFVRLEEALKAGWI
jgi:hypothetical protein